MQQHCKGSTSTPPLVARLCQIREASLVALRKFSKIFACSRVSIVRLGQSTIPVSSDSHHHSPPLYHLSGEFVSISSVPIGSIHLNLWKRSCPSAFVPISLGFTSVLTDDIVISFRHKNPHTSDKLFGIVPGPHNGVGPCAVGKVQSAKASSRVLMLFLLLHRHAVPLKSLATRSIC